MMRWCLKATLYHPMWGLRSCTSVDDEDDIADLKVMKFLEQPLRCHMSGTSTYLHTYGDHDDLRNS
jgi:hypothetical protein